ncbi:phosphotransferase [Psychroflexus montanilacus]|uniref:phosphotransferase n=1 Tax=Psychroflexus montanilacus TaxID=2873598 RepID=UPI001CCB1A51|nr:phosphotransferase [Psychroflexus montanilacus]MBZ9651152.1 phosphotransferase [Psychroflexus montanilacus]
MVNDENITINDIYQYESDWANLFENERFLKEFCEDILEPYIINQRWYGGKASALKYIEIIDYFKIESKHSLYYGIVVEINFKEAFVQNYFIPIGIVKTLKQVKNNYIAAVDLNTKKAYVVDALLIKDFQKAIFEKLLEGRKDEHVNVEFRKGRACEADKYSSSKLMGVEQSNTSIIYNKAYILKIFRRVYTDQNPDYEISKYLTIKGHFKNTPSYAGSITLKFSDKNIITLGLMQELISNEGDAWEYYIKNLEDCFSTLSKKKLKVKASSVLSKFKQISVSEIDPEILKWCTIEFFEDISKLAKRTGEMHVTLGMERVNMSFTPQAYSYDYSVWLKNRLIYMLDNRINLLENNLHKLEGLRLELAQDLLKNKKEVKKRFLDFDEAKLKSERIRIHGDYHLGQVLVKDRDFYIIDFEGEPESTIRDRKVKQPPLKDVAGMFRSFNYAIYATIFNNLEKYTHSIEDLFHAGDVLYSTMVGVFLDTYISEVQSKNLNIGYIKEIEFLLEYCLLEKAIYELGYELNARPRWAIIPLKGISNILNDDSYERS